MNKFYRLARECCCNFYGSFNNRHNVCAYEGECVLKDGGQCSWFERAVLPLDPALQEQYHQQVAHKAPAKKKHKIIVKRRCKTCKKPVAGRRLYCDKCKARKRRESARKSMRKKREARAGC